MTRIEITSDETLTEEEVKKILDTVKKIEKSKPDRIISVWIEDKNQKERTPEEAKELVEYFVKDEIAG